MLDYFNNSSDKIIKILDLKSEAESLDPPDIHPFTSD